MGSGGLLFILGYAFAFATFLVFRSIMKNRKRIASEQEALPLVVKQIRFVVILLISAVSGWGAWSGQISPDLSVSVFYGGIALTAFLTSNLGQG